LLGAKRYATGAALLDGALVTAHGPEGLLLVLVGREAFGRLDPGGWRAHAFEGTGTATVDFDVIVPAEAQVGAVGWYLDRPGFWHGGVGVAACWAGAAAGLVEHLRRRWTRRDPHSLARLGAAEATAWAMGALVRRAAEEIDAAPEDVLQAEHRSRRARFMVDRMANEVLDQLLRGAGPGPVAFEEDLERRFDEVRLYTRQCHGEREIEPLGGYLAPS
jgi:alkylation response protein AidB-like acyl-CoA dehydrogenase